MQWGHRLTELVPAQAGGHRLRFANGVEHEADIVIGADGAWSKVRAALSACEPLPTGITFFEGWIERPAADISAMVGQGSLFCFGGEEALFVQRNSRDRLCVYAALKRSSEWLDARIAQHGMRTLVTGSYAGWAPNLRRVLEACTDFVRRPIYSLASGFPLDPARWRDPGRRCGASDAAGGRGREPGNAGRVGCGDGVVCAAGCDQRPP